MLNWIIFIGLLVWSVAGVCVFVKIIDPLDFKKVNRVKLIFLSILCGVLAMSVVVGIFLGSLNFSMKKWLET